MFVGLRLGLMGEGNRLWHGDEVLKGELDHENSDSGI
jgi:hypothetical protein